MKLHTLLVALLLAATVWLGLSRLSSAGGKAIRVVATAYSCDDDPRNPLYPCSRLRWGGNPYGAGMACPYWWRGRYMEVPGFGVLRCDDTGRYDMLYGLPHIDIRVPSYRQAYNMGYRWMTIYAVDSPPPVRSAPRANPSTSTTSVASTLPATPPTTVASATPVTSAEGALELAHRLEPKGDTKTALVRLLRVSRAKKHFPVLFEKVTLAPDHPVWAITLWVPPSAIPEGTVAKPDPSAEVTARFFVFDGKTGELVTDTYVSRNTVETMGWLASDNLELGR
ncbi:MAG: hypothetical protein M3220_22695 [Chloroflexota bacterium]|nr:hypothetical protein [Chloroflexota bacterium]